MSFDVKYVHQVTTVGSCDPVIDILEDAADCDAVILMGWKDGSLYITQSEGDVGETLATLNLASQFLNGLLINTSGTLH